MIRHLLTKHRNIYVFVYDHRSHRNTSNTPQSSSRNGMKIKWLWQTFHSLHVADYKMIGFYRLWILDVSFQFVIKMYFNELLQLTFGDNGVTLAYFELSKYLWWHFIWFDCCWNLQFPLKMSDEFVSTFELSWVVCNVTNGHWATGNGQRPM